MTLCCNFIMCVCNKRGITEGGQRGRRGEERETAKVEIEDKEQCGDFK